MRITRRIEFDSGHRVVGHKGKCRYFHGHRYAAEITVSSHGLDMLGRVIDFGVVKEVAGKWIDDNWDHNMILSRRDPIVKAIRKLNKNQPLHEAFGWDDFVFEREPYLMDNPTAENMAKHLFSVLQHILIHPNPHLTLERVRIYETPNCWADYPE